MKPLTLNRRKFLGSSMALIQLPFLESFMAGPAAAKAIPPAEAKRLVYIGIGFGVTKSTWYPDASQTGKNFILPEGLAPLERHQDGLSVIQNLTHQHSRNGHAGSTYWLTGANCYAVPGKNFHNTISVDQVAAQQLGLQTRFSSLQFTGSKTNTPASGHGPGLSLSWDRDGKPINALATPNDLFHQLFSNPNVSIQEQRAAIAKKRSVLDTVFADVKSMKKRINHEDQQKLEEYIQSLRDIEVRLAKEESWIGVPKKKPPHAIKEPSQSLEGKQEVEIMYDLMVAAMQVDATRVMTYRLPADTFLQSIGVKETAHATSHYSERGGDPKVASQKKDLAHSELLAGFFDKLKAHKEPNGRSLFDLSTITYGGNISSMHNLDNCPSLVAGGGSGFTQGQNIVMKDDATPLCNLWLSQLNGSGIITDQFGDSSGIIKELYS